MALTLRKPSLPRAPRAPGAGHGGEAVLGIGMGALIGLIAGDVPMILLAIPMVGLIGLSMLLRAQDLTGLAWGTFVAVAFTVPMNRIGVGPFEVSDYILFLSLGCYIMMRLQQAAPVSYTAYKPFFAAMGLMGLGGAIGMFFEPPGPYFYWLPDYNIAGFGGNVANLARFLLGTCLPLALFALAQLDRKQLITLLTAFAMGQAFGSFLGLAGAVPGGNGRNWGLSEHPGHFGTLCLLAMACVVALFVHRNTITPWMAGAAAVLLAGSYTSGSRAALGGMALFLLAVGPLTRRKLIMGAALAGVATVILALSLGLGQKVGGENALARSLSNTSTAQDSNAFREKTQSDLWHRWSQHPLTGTGFNYIRPSHNVYLGIGASTGVIGILGFLYFLRTLGRRVWRNRHDQVVVVIAAGYGSYLFVAWFDNLFWWRWLWFYIAALIGLCATAVRPGEEGDEAETAVAEGAVGG